MRTPLAASAAALTLVLTGVQPAQANTLATGVTQHVTFNDSKVSGGHARIMIEWRDAINGAPAGAKLRIVQWKWEAPSSSTNVVLTEVTDAVIAAHKRGVDVMVAYKGGNETTESARLKTALGSRFVTCNGADGISNGACVSNRSGGSAHNKLLAVSATGTRKHVVMVSSANVANSQLRTYNDNVVTAGDQVYFDQMMNYFDDVMNKRKNNNYAAGEGHFTSPGSLLETWVGPRADRYGGTTEDTSTDTVAQLLKRVKGQAGCRVRIMVSRYDAKRSGTASQIKRIRLEGAQVRGLLRTDGSSTAKSEITAATGTDALGSPYWRTGDPHVHTKSVIFTGCGGGDRVLFGSGNWTGDLRKNDEYVGESTNPAIVAAYVKQWDLVAGRAGVQPFKS